MFGRRTGPGDDDDDDDDGGKDEDMALGAISFAGQLQGRMASRWDITPGIKVMDLHDRLRYGENDHICKALLKMCMQPSVHSRIINYENFSG